MVGKYTLQSVGMALLSQGDEEWVCICSNTGRGLWNCLDKYYEKFSKSLRSNVIRYTNLYILLQSVPGKISAEAYVLSWLTTYGKHVHDRKYFFMLAVDAQAHCITRSSAAMVFTIMMTLSNGNIFSITGHLCGEFTGHRWIPRTKANEAELWCFLWSALEQMVE